jgi:hypothetical protein
MQSCPSHSFGTTRCAVIGSNLGLCIPFSLVIVSPEVVDPGVILPDRATCESMRRISPERSKSSITVDKLTFAMTIPMRIRDLASMSSVDKASQHGPQFCVLVVRGLPSPDSTFSSAFQRQLEFKSGGLLSDVPVFIHLDLLSQFVICCCSGAICPSIIKVRKAPVLLVYIPEGPAFARV